MRPINLQRLKLLHPTVKDRCIYQKNTVVDLDRVLGIDVTRDAAQHLLHHVTYAFTMFDVATSNG